MGIARINRVKRANKDQGDCNLCKKPIKKGDAYNWWAIGFRSRFKNKRCAVCKLPRPSQLESNSSVSTILAASEQLEDELKAASCAEDIKAAMENAESNVQEAISDWEDKKSNLESTFTGGSPIIEDIEEKLSGAENLSSELASFDVESIEIPEGTSQDEALELLRNEARAVWDSNEFL